MIWRRNTKKSAVSGRDAIDEPAINLGTFDEPRLVGEPGVALDAKEMPVSPA
jgi:hypothetical protein